MTNIIIKKNVNTDFKKEVEKINEFLDNYNSFPQYLLECMENYCGLKAIIDEANGVDLTYEQVIENINLFSSALQEKGIHKGDFVALISENNGLHFICHQGIMKTGACSVLRGTSSPNQELEFILNHSEAKGLIISDYKVLNRLAEIINNNQNLQFVVILFESGEKPENLNKPVFPIKTFIEFGRNHEFIQPEMNINDNALMMYTSGTTGFPKGVLLSHKNVLSQMLPTQNALNLKKGMNSLQILPVWHAYEMLTQSLFFSLGLYLHFTNLKRLKDDIKNYDIDMFMSVPRIWESLRLDIYQNLKKKSKLGYYIFDFAIKTSILYKIHKMYSEKRITNKKSSYKLTSNIYHKIARAFIKPLHILFNELIYKKLKNKAGLNFYVSVSGGGSLSLKDELFYDAMGINLRIGYGLTETSPVLTIRHVDDKNYLCSVGKPLMATEVKIVEPNERYELGVFEKGLVLVRGPQVMKGYYKDEEATRKVVDNEGWFNTGDLGWLTNDNQLVLVGRMKETIVLSSGENVEPVPIEEACLQSNYIEQIVLVGQDEPGLGALVVPSKEALEKCGLTIKELNRGTNLVIKNPDLKEFIKKEIDNYIKSKPNLKSFEKIKNIEILKDGFNRENDLLSQTGKLKRNKIFDKYQDFIKKMFSNK